ncbi:MAG TPA: tetratricopeptide repeat protein [Thermoanaerobaculia bacterium]|nr:tetratricopeptide repeat protein [Thermoanaerobaculia bacterium]
MALAWALLAACGGAESRSAELVDVGRPPDLDQLDASVQEQFEETWGDLHGGERGLEAAEAGAAWGRLGQWFQTYDYAASAAASYGNAHRLDADEPRWPFYLGLLAEQAGDLDAAHRHFEAAAVRAPEVAEPRVRLGDLALEQQRLEEAELHYREVLALDPQNPGALLGSGRLALLQGDPQAAVEALEPLARSQPHAVEVHYSLALAWRRLGDEERAAEHLGRVPEDAMERSALDQEAPWLAELRQLDVGARTLTRRGIRAARRGERKRAAFLLGRAVAADPDGPEKRINYALALRQLNHQAEARRQLEAAVRLCEDDPEMSAKAHLELGRLLATVREPAAAIEHLETALAVDPRSAQAHLVLGRLLHAQGRLEEARERFAAARDLDPADVDARFGHAEALLRLDRRREAVTALEADLARLGDERLLRLFLARLLAAAPADEPRDVPRARRLLDGDATPPDVLYAETAAMVEAGAGRFAAAVAWQQAAVDALEGGPRAALHTARRRLVLYESGTASRNPWESTETALGRPVVAP